MIKYLIVDFLSLAYRSYHGGGQKLIASDGTPTSILYRASQTLLAEQKFGNYDQIIVCKDPSRGSEGQPKVLNNRKAIDPLYKANRSKPSDPNFAIDSDNLLTLLSLLGVPIRETAGFEADDLAGTLAVKHSAQGHSVALLTGDTDFLQLVTEHNEGPGSVTVRRLTPGKVLTFGWKECLGYFGVTPDKVVDFKALNGDGCDNIPGVPGVGPKSAQKYLAKWGNSATAAMAEPKLLPYASQIQQSYRLAKIDLDSPIEDWASSQNCESSATAEALLEKLECRSLIKRIRSLCLSNDS